ncbi:MAG TPA: hypothetical protein VGH28_02945 [Polyangiaceae bacterium]|jgi:hypothetical protein
MRSWNIFARFEAALLVALASAACSSTEPPVDASTSCSFALSGNTNDTASPATCATVGAGDAGGSTLTISGVTPAFARIQAEFDLGAAPSAGQLTNETVASWDFVAVASSSTCTFQAGSDAVPLGNFSLTIASIDASSGVAHGTLTLLAYVHAPAQTDCGYDDTENVSVQF